jgi:hypothetical protein
MDELELNDIILILGVNINANVSIEIHMTYDKPFIFMKKIIKKLI